MKKSLLISIALMFIVGKMYSQLLVLTVTVTTATVCTPPGCNGTATVSNVGGGTPPYTYLWNIPLAPQMTQTATGLCPGSYQIGVFDSSTPLPKQGQQLVTITCSTASGVNAVSADESINIFPNPSAGIFSVSGLTQNSEVSVINILGENVCPAGKRINSTKAGQLTINLSDKPGGIYFVQISTEKGIVSKKVMIVR